MEEKIRNNMTQLYAVYKRLILESKPQKKVKRMEKDTPYQKIAKVAILISHKIDLQTKL